MTHASATAAQRQGKVTPLLVAGVVVGVLALPVAVWLDLRALSDRLLHLQAAETSRIINDMRGLYASAVVAHVVEAKGSGVTLTRNFQTTPGGIPIPETMSIELAKAISSQDGNVKYRFVSDKPFRGRADHRLDAFEKDALGELHADPERDIVAISGSIFDRSIRTAAPIIMAKVCVDCHNTDPDSPKQDWKVGEVGGIQETIVHQPIPSNVFSFKFLLTYLVAAALAGLTFILHQQRQARLIAGMNDELAGANSFLESISGKISKYLPPQIYESIFSGEKDVVIHTERKKLTIFFSDIKDFTETAERLQPEDLTALLNEYFTEMSAIAERHGGTVDKFIGDAMLVFFGDPDTKGLVGDARACVTMALEMQRRLAQLNLLWRKRGIEKPFQMRVGINTGFCNVGNFGSMSRMDYTIIGAEGNLASRLQSIAEPGTIMLSYETYALVSDLVAARRLPPIQMKGIGREVVPYLVEGLASAEGAAPETVIVEHIAGLDFVLDVEALDDMGAEQARRRLEEGLRAIDRAGLPEQRADGAAGRVAGSRR